MIRKKIQIALVMMCLALFPLYGQKQTPPEGGKPKNFTLPEIENFKLDNGLQVSMVHYGILPKASLQLVLRVGNINEKPDEVWLADLTGDMLKEGTTTLTSRQIAEKAADMGGSVDVSVGPDQMNMGGSVLQEFAPDMVQLMADMVEHPAFPETEIGRLKKNMLRRLTVQKNQPRSQAIEKFDAVLYGDHPYGRIFPTPTMINSYDLQKVKAFYLANYGAKRAHLYIVGKFDGPAVRKAVEAAFKDWKPGSDPFILKPSPKSEKKVYLIDRPGAPQSTIYLGLPVADPSSPDFLPLMVMNNLLGGSFASRITSNIREDKGYTYSPHSQVTTHYRDAYWLEVADVTTKFTGPSLKEIFYEIKRLQQEPPSAEELKGIQNYMAGTFVLRNSNPGSIINQLAFMNLHGLDASYLRDYVKNVYAVTPEQVQEMARRYLKTDRMTIVVVGDKKVVKRQLRPYGKIVL